MAIVGIIFCALALAIFFGEPELLFGLLKVLGVIALVILMLFLLT